MITGSVRLSEDARYCQVSALAYALQRGIPSPRGRVTSRSPLLLQHMHQNINWSVIACPSRVRLSPRLTLIRLTLFRKPWVFGVNISIFIVVTYAYIFFSRRSSRTHIPPSALASMLPYHPTSTCKVHGFGCGLHARSSSTRHRSTSELLRTL